MNGANFKLENNKIYSTVTGDLVATVEETGIKMQPGKNALTPRVKAFYDSVDRAAENPTAGQELMEEKQDFQEFAENAAAETGTFDGEEEEVNTHLLGEERMEFSGPEKTGTPELERSSGHTSSKALAVWDIPEDLLPDFSPALGVSTPEFKAFVKKHKFSKDQVIELVKRLENIKFRKGN